jgi:hypothetical protein
MGNGDSLGNKIYRGVGDKVFNLRTMTHAAICG